MASRVLRILQPFKAANTRTSMYQKNVQSSVLVTKQQFGIRTISSLNSSLHSKQLLPPTSGVKVPSRNISSEKKKESEIQVSASLDQTKPDKKNWVSFGYDNDCQEADLQARNGTMFFMVTITFVIGGFYIAYFPDLKMRNWSQREAFLTLARREAQGLPPIDKNIVPEDCVNLPSEEELGDFEIII